MSKKILQAAAGAAGGESVYVEDVFSTYLYTSTNSTLNIENGIDLSNEGGMVWIKNRDGSSNHNIVHVPGKFSVANTTDTELTSATTITSFNTNGFTLGSDSNFWSFNWPANQNFCSWTFRQAPGFFDVVTYTGDGVAGRTISHNLDSVPGCIIVISLTPFGFNRAVYHRSLANSEYLHLNTSNAKFSSSTHWNNTTPTSSVFTVGTSNETNRNTSTYVAFLFAHDDQSFGDDSDESIIKCGSYTGNGSAGNSIDVGFEPQWLMVKAASGGNASGQNWALYDMMRGFNMGDDAYLEADTSDAEANWNDLNPTATGFVSTSNSGNRVNESGTTYIYVAIRRPMKTPEAGSDVLAINTRAGYTGSEQEVDTTIVPDLVYINSRDKTNEHWGILSTRLQGAGKSFFTTGTYAEISDTTEIKEFGPEQTSITLGSSNTVGENGVNFVDYYMKRATGFMDVVAYTGTGSATTISHNLGVVPELLIIKNRSGASDSWVIYDKFADLTTSTPLFSDFKTGGRDYPKLSINSTAPTASVFSIGPAGYSTNTSGVNYIAYMWASVAGVSKIGSYSGTGSNVDVDCGFSAGARFVMITRSDSGGNWYVWDSARGIVAGNDPYLQIGEQDAEVTNTDYIDPLNAGFTVTSSAPAALNASGGTYIFLAIA